jgi:hypothetical protein
MPFREPDTIIALGFCGLRQSKGLIEGLTLRPIVAVVAFHHQSKVHHSSPFSLIGRMLMAGDSLPDPGDCHVATRLLCQLHAYIKAQLPPGQSSTWLTA